VTAAIHPIGRNPNKAGQAANNHSKQEEESMANQSTSFTTGLPALRQGQPAPAALLQRRVFVANSRKDHAVDPAIAVAERMRGGVRGIECSAPGARRTILHFHGGGYRMGEPQAWVPFGAWLARVAEANVIFPDYRVAPENPFPAAVHDAVAVYADLVAGRKPVLVSGDSAGGGLAAALAVAIQGTSLPQPPGLVLISPWLDLTVEAPTYASRATTDKLFSREAAKEGSGQYLQGHSARDPLASPLFADLHGFPPTLLLAGGDEVLLGDSLAFANRLAEAGATVEAHFVAHMQHVWPTVFPDLPESALAMEAINHFARRLIPG
jgi:acetyl esterase/lipase